MKLSTNISEGHRQILISKMSINPDRIHAARRKIAEVSTIVRKSIFAINLMSLFRYHILRQAYILWKGKYSINTLIILSFSFFQGGGAGGGGSDTDPAYVW